MFDEHGSRRAIAREAKQKEKLEQESIYKLIPPAQKRKAKPPMHKSKFAGDSVPTGSSFGVAKTLGGNFGGEAVREKQLRDKKKSAATFGPPADKKLLAPNPKKFLRRHEKEPQLPDPTKFEYHDRRKPALSKSAPAKPPKRHHKNFIAENAVKNIMAASKKPENKEVDYRNKADYGKVPKYLQQVKEAIKQEHELITSLVENEQQNAAANTSAVKMLSDEDRVALCDALKKKWDHVNKQYQAMTHMTTLDTVSQIRRKEEFEKQLAQLEKSIDKLSKKMVFVRDE